MYHLILLTCHKKFLSPSYQQNVHHKIIIISHHKQASMPPKPYNALGHPLHIVVVLEQVVPESEGPVVVPHANKVAALGLVVNKVA
jgi:hypothetical protein